MREKFQKYDINYETKKALEKITIWVAWKLPRGLIKWSAIRLMAHATTGKYSNTVTPELSAIDALNRWETA